MKSGFGHFDDSHRENFCAAALLLTMDVEPAVKEVVGESVREALGLPESFEVMNFGREARLAVADEEDGYARVDLWLLFRSGDERRYGFVEVKTHDRWSAEEVAGQVLDQASRPRLARGGEQIAGSVLLAPDRLCARVREVEPRVPTISWSTLIARVRAKCGDARLTQHVLRHLEAHVERPTGIANRTLSGFQEATTTIACLRQFLVSCVAEIGGGRASGVNTTPGDGEPYRWNGWAWFGVSVPFSLQDEKYRLGIYQYVEAPPGEESARETLWLEAYVGDNPVPIAFVKFDPPTLGSKDLDAIRTSFVEVWRNRQAQRS